MKMTYLIAAAAGLVMGGAIVATEISAGPAESVKYRQTVMKGIGAHMGAITMVVKGEVVNPPSLGHQGLVSPALMVLPGDESGGSPAKSASSAGVTPEVLLHLCRKAVDPRALGIDLGALGVDARAEVEQAPHGRRGEQRDRGPGRGFHE